MQRQTILFIVAFVVIIIIILASLARPKVGGDSNKSEAKPPIVMTNVLLADESFYDFGTVSMKDGKVSKRFSFSNTSSTSPITLAKLYTSCMCTEASLFVGGLLKRGPFGMPGHGAVPSFEEVLAPQENAEIEAVFDPNAHGPAGIGKISREIKLETENGESLSFSFTANVTP